MCQTIVINNGEKTLQTVREFKKHFNLIGLDEDVLVVDDWCLCQIDVGEELKKLNIEYEYDFCDYYIKQPAND